MEIKIAKYLFQHTKNNKWHLERNNENWLLYVNNQIIKTARGQKKEYRTIEAAIKDIEQITRKRVNTLALAEDERQEEISLA